MLISFEVYQDDQAFVRLDREGLTHLRSQLDRLENNSSIQLSTPVWGGNDLTEAEQGTDRSVIHRVTFVLDDGAPLG